PASRRTPRLWHRQAARRRAAGRRWDHPRPAPQAREQPGAARRPESGHWPGGGLPCRGRYPPVTLGETIVYSLDNTDLSACKARNKLG
nr:hypothetical protein [Tanacetum cinerariifolium]